MMNKSQLAALLRSVPVADLAREADVATKTIYRLRHQVNSPTLNTVEKLVKAVERMKRGKKRAAK